MECTVSVKFLLAGIIFFASSFITCNGTAGMHLLLIPFIRKFYFPLTLLFLQMRLYQVVGRKAPTKSDENPPAYRMKLFAPNEVMAKSRFWYFMHQMRKMKKTTGEILDVNEVRDKRK